MASRAGMRSIFGGVGVAVSAGRGRDWLCRAVLVAAVGVAAASSLAQERRDPPSSRNPLATRPTPASDAGRDPRLAPPVLDGTEEYTPEERSNIEVYERCNRGVVHITTQTTRRDNLFLLAVPQKGEGSGSVIDQAGHVLTNYHVIEGAEEIQVNLFNGEAYAAGLVGADPANDMAVLRITAPPEALYPIPIGDSSRLRVGQTILAIGNPFGLERTLTVGIVSSLNRVIPSRTGRQMKSIIQIDAALNQGNSGGPLLNRRGEIVGMNTAIANPSQSGESTGVGFAIPATTLRRVVPQLIEHGKVIRPAIGISAVYETERGLLIVEVIAGGPAERAGLKGFQFVTKRERRGPFVYERSYLDREHADLIVAVDGQPVTTADAFQDYVESKKPGDRIVVRVQRGETTVDVAVILGGEE